MFVGSRLIANAALLAPIPIAERGAQQLRPHASAAASIVYRLSLCTFAANLPNPFTNSCDLPEIQTTPFDLRSNALQCLRRSPTSPRET